MQIVKSNNYDYVKISNGSSTINSLLVNGLSEFTSKATFEAGISVTGTAEATTFNATSDKRLKENIIDYKPEKSILDLPIKKFDFIDGPKNQIGCIAQDLKEICPEIVNENEKGYLSIQENKLVYLLLDEVKKLKNEVEELKRK
ncbi:tail fiber domain-containing protein [Intestinibacter sp.]|uniref:tail fiber domain-containing protein n=1 Tax=Intestinibacter sp. TaxID=1965304 RepID=UPI002A757D54|nr:tail fiber domain-containing protein [Intestinibacter sp.]MDY2737104.1 tail fiber domain-containing protein [Intestinibacter sp.]